VANWHDLSLHGPLSDECRTKLIRVVGGEGVDPKLPSPPVLKFQCVGLSKHNVLVRSHKQVACPVRGGVNPRRTEVDVDVCGIEANLVPLEELSPVVMHHCPPHGVISGC